MILNRIIPCAADYDMWSYACSECTTAFSMVEARMEDRAEVDERRSVPRHAVTTPATITFGGRTVACTVRNFSATGAGLNLAGRLRLPKHFLLTAAGSELLCRAIWRRGTAVGIAFD
jgi:PilZ domain